MPPQVLPRFLTSTLYRWEVTIWTTIVVGFGRAGGPGRECRRVVSCCHDTAIALITLTYGC